MNSLVSILAANKPKSLLGDEYDDVTSSSDSDSDNETQLAQSSTGATALVPHAAGARASGGPAKGNELTAIDEQGRRDYGALVRGSQNNVHRYQDLLPKDIDPSDPSFNRPDEETEQSTIEATREALNKQLANRMKAANPTRNILKETSAPTMIHYTPQNETKERVVMMIQRKQDPLEPPKFRARKLPVGPSEPTAPVMRSPPRALSAKEQAAWYIPPSISNYKNAKGHVVPLDKRVAADGKALQETTSINERFGSMTAALDQANALLRKDIQRRRQIEDRAKDLERAQLEDRLAREAMETRSTLAETTRAMTEEERQRDAARRDLAYDVRREMRMSATGRTRERDTSEDVALGQARPTGRTDGDMLVDQRVYARAQALDGAGSGRWNDEDAYNVYTDPLYSTASRGVYVPTDDGSGAGARRGPVEFERDTAPHMPTTEADDTGRPARGGPGTGAPADDDRSHYRDDRRDFRDRSPGRDHDRDRRMPPPSRGGRHDDEDDDVFGVDALMDSARHSRSARRPREDSRERGYDRSSRDRDRERDRDYDRRR